MKCFFVNTKKQENMLRSSLFLRKTQTSRVNNSRFLRIMNAKFSGCCFYMNPVNFGKLNSSRVNFKDYEFRNNCFQGMIVCVVS